MHIIARMSVSSRSPLTTSALVVLVVVAIGVFVATLVRAVFYAPDDSNTSLLGFLTPQPAIATSTSTPSRLLVPALSIDAHVQLVGLNSKGAMQAPSNFTDVAWYHFGTVPGQLGSAVIDGHVDNGLGLPGVFKHLGDIEVGDDVYIVSKDGTKLHFRVSEIEAYPYTDAPTEKIFNSRDQARLTLITCTGTWVRGKDTYNERLVVYTTFVGTASS
jgi:sortase A